MIYTFDSAHRRVIQSSPAKEKKGYQIPRILSWSLLIILLFASSFSVVRLTRAYFTDSVSSTPSSFTTSTLSSGTLSFDVIPEEGFVPAVIHEAERSYRKMRIVNTGTMDFKYQVTAVVTFGDPEFCKQLEFFGIFHEGFVYLSHTIQQPIWVYGTDGGDWNFKTYYWHASPELSNKQCGFDFIFRGWQKDRNLGDPGFTHTVVVSNVITGAEITDLIIGDTVIEDIEPVIDPVFDDSF